MKTHPRKKTNLLKIAFIELPVEITKTIIVAILGFIVKFVWNIYGAIVLALLSFALLGLLKWLQIPIKLPVYFLLVLVVVSIFFTIVLQWMTKKMRARTHLVMFEGLGWRIDNSGIIIGPICPNCRKKELSAASNIQEQLDKAASVIFGDLPSYSFSCSCGYRIIKDKSRTELMDNLRNTLLLENEREKNVENV